MDPIVLLIIFAAMMIPLFLMSSRQRKAAREQQERLKLLEIGDEVRTHSGFFGLIVDMYDDIMILETESGAQTKWLRAAIAERIDSSAAADTVADESSLEDDEPNAIQNEDASDSREVRDQELPSSMEEPVVDENRIGEPVQRIGEDPEDPRDR